MCPAVPELASRDARARPSSSGYHWVHGARPQPPQEPGDPAAGWEGASWEHPEPSCAGLRPGPPAPAGRSPISLGCTPDLSCRTDSGCVRPRARWLPSPHCCTRPVIQGSAEPSRDSPQPTPHSHHSRDVPLQKIYPHPFCNNSRSERGHTLIGMASAGKEEPSSQMLELSAQEA